MKEIKPYLLTAYYNWISDSDCTPYLYVNTRFSGVNVPSQLLAETVLVLNISITACQNLVFADAAVTFSARFSGIVRDIYLPIDSIIALVAKENSKGISFAEIAQEKSVSENLSSDKPSPKPQVREKRLVNKAVLPAKAIAEKNVASVKVKSKSATTKSVNNTVTNKIAKPKAPIKRSNPRLKFIKPE